MKTKLAIKSRRARKVVPLRRTRKRTARPSAGSSVRKGSRFAVREGSRRPGGADGRKKRLELKAATAGTQAAKLDGEGAIASSSRMQQSFREWAQAHLPQDLPFAELLPVALAYRRGYASAAGLDSPWIPLSLQGSASAIVTASNEEKTLPAVLAELRKLPLREIIVVLNGCSDGSFSAVEKDPRVTRLNFPERLGHDVGRAIGAAAAVGDILLFTDGDICVPAEELAAFLVAVDRGDDLALNDVSPYLPAFALQDEVTRCKAFLNQALGRADLKANSLTAVPHALSRRALGTVGTRALIVPPKAQALALARGLTVNATISVDVIRKNRVRSGNSGAGNAVAQMIIGDHVEALAEVMKTEGVRLRFATLSRSELAKARNA
ncbi:glycosyltransferase family 2 protein [Paenibacillus macerans]|uniref:glycosyltransferase family 2 protein n=1 Tax=Paenibacillus macerans TaxID=44252 RepID=UPI003D31619C